MSLRDHKHSMRRRYTLAVECFKDARRPITNHGQSEYDVPNPRAELRIPDEPLMRMCAGVST